MSENIDSGEFPPKKSEEVPAAEIPAASPVSSWSSWFEDTKKKTIELAEKAKVAAEAATKVAQEKAMELAKQADEMRQKYDMEIASSIMASLGGPMDTSVPNNKGPVRKPKTSVLDLVYVTENLVAMAFPIDPRKPSGHIEGGNDINAVSTFLRHKHGTRFMIWNVSEEAYDYAKFGDQVLEYKFPGHPAPPLGLLFNICTSIESWLDADDLNVAVIHCLTGKGRTAALMACVLTWIGEFISPMEALQYVAERRGMPAEFLTIPSQRRYVQYFSNMLDGVKPRSEPLLLRRVIINGVPSFGDNAGGESNRGCCPYIQLFKCGKLVATAAPPKDIEGDDDNSSDRMQLKWVKIAEGSVSFSIDAAVQGDILLRCRHADSSGARVSMFRAAFHTGYVPCGVLRLTKAQLDGACSDPRFDDEFFIDLIFAPIEKAANVDLLAPGSSAGGAIGVPSDSGLIIDSSDKYEASLHKDAKFWEAVSQRKLKAKKRRSRKFVKSAAQEQFSISDEPFSSHSDDHADIIKFSLSSVSSPPVNSISGMSDMELIMQLARAEEEDHLVDGDNEFKIPSVLTGELGKVDETPTPSIPSTSTAALSVTAAADVFNSVDTGLPASDAVGDDMVADRASSVDDLLSLHVVAPPPPPVAAAALPSTTSSDTELLPPPPPSDTAAAAPVAVAFNTTAIPSVSDLLGGGGEAETTPVVSIPASTPSVTTTAAAAAVATDSLSLEELEKELGLGLGTDNSSSSSSTTAVASASAPSASAPSSSALVGGLGSAEVPAAAATTPGTAAVTIASAAASLDDDLDELERYLSKFSTPST